MLYFVNKQYAYAIICFATQASRISVDSINVKWTQQTYASTLEYYIHTPPLSEQLASHLDRLENTAFVMYCMPLY